MDDTTIDVFAERWLDFEIYQLRRGTRDLYGRAVRGSVFYMAASILYALTLGGTGRLSLLAWLATLVFALLGLFRYLNKVPPDSADPVRFRRWRFRHWAVIDAGCLLWSVLLLEASLMGQPYSVTLMVALLATCAFSNGISHSYAMDRRGAFIALGCLMIPGTVVFGMIIPGGWPIAVGFVGQAAYTVAMADRSNKEYRAQIATEHALILSRAETERLVRTDGLTGLANRREYERGFAQAWHMAARQRGNLALLVLDLDNFKKLNDSYGHAAGDACLRHFSEILSRHFRRVGDLTARIGGEEFAVVLPNATALDAATLGEEFRQELEQSRCLYNDQVIAISASIGAGAVDWLEDRDPDATFARVDRGCYEAKKQGRSRLVAI